MTDSSLMRGPGFVRCAMCGELHVDPYPNLAVIDGEMWDLCAGPCADMASGTADDQ